LKKQRISIFSAFHPFRGGIAQFNERLVIELLKENEVQTFTFKKQYPDFLFPGTTQFVASKNKGLVAQRIVSTFNPFTYFSGAKKIKQSKPTIFIVNYWMPIFAVFTALFSIFLPKKIKKIALVHNLIPHEKRFIDAFLNRLFLSQYSHFIVLSKAVEQAILSIQPTATIKHIQHPWYDHFGEKIDKQQAKQQLGVSLEKKTLLFFGLIRDYKGLDVLLKSFNQLSEDYQLIIAGEVYGKTEKYNQLIMKSANTAIYFFNQYIPDDEVAIYFSAADVCILPYKSATQSGITATSFHFEVPLIASNVGGLAEAIENGKTGIIVPPNDEKALILAIEDVFAQGKVEIFQENIRDEKSKNSWVNFSKELINFVLNEC
jgi:glycosyltransferase involved in cell wall biosynthesis